MFNNRSTFIQSLQNRKGQVALFVALIFQILFLFFAMVINVGLLVHHKINLQNSVDLAAYYGAMKQAEGMNAIGHINYQIRQSWKLLAWRYRMIGTAGDFEEHPFNKPTRGLKNNDDDNGIPIRSDAQGFYESPSFCSTYIPFKEMPPGENTCRSLVAYSKVNYPAVPPVVIDLPGISNKVRELVIKGNISAADRCRYFGAFNYIVLGGFVVAYNIDQGDKMLLISQLSQAMSPSNASDDFYDIDGKSVHEGIEKTLKNNLTSANRSGLGDVKIHNSLGDPRCNRTGVASGNPAKWLKPIKIYPGFKYIDTSCEGGITPQDKALGQKPNYYQTNFTQEVQELEPFIGTRQPLENVYNFSVGVEKNPWCMAYVGVSAVAEPKVPFSPFGAIRLKARAFYKPFGGRIGPWFNTRWPSTSEISQGGGQTDPLLPPRLLDISGLATNQNDPTRSANYSRYIGDNWGLKSRRALFQYGRSIFGLNPNWTASANGTVSSTGVQNIDYADQAPSFEHWNHLPFSFAAQGGNGDILAWDHARDGISRMRELELTAVLPDTFDFAYYSIEPDFYNNYYKRISDGFLKGPGASFASSKTFRPDIGHHKGYKRGGIDLEDFSVKDQYKMVQNSEYVKRTLDIDQKLSYISQKWEHALTSWAPKDLLDYSMDLTKFGKCLAYPVGNDRNKANPPTAGNCVVGGSTGYSVKMVSSDYLRLQNLVLGGEGTSGSAILNPPPSDEDF